MEDAQMGDEREDNGFQEKDSPVGRTTNSHSDW